MYTQQDQPIFDSAHEALLFAFRHMQRSPKTPLQTLVMSGGELPERSTKELSGEYALIVAGGIMYHVCQLFQGEKMAIIGRYTYRVKPKMRRKLKVKVSDEYELTSKFKDACELLSRHPDIKNKTQDDALRCTLIARYFGERQNMQELAGQVGITDRWLREINRPIKQTLQKLEDRAVMLISQKLKERGFC